MRIQFLAEPLGIGWNKATLPDSPPAWLLKMLGWFISALLVSFGAIIRWDIGKNSKMPPVQDIKIMVETALTANENILKQTLQGTTYEKAVLSSEDIQKTNQGPSSSIDFNEDIELIQKPVG